MPEPTPAPSLRHLPAIDQLLNHRQGQQLIRQFGHRPAAQALAVAVDGVRQRLLAGEPVEKKELRPDALAARARRRLAALTTPGPKAAINATGIVLHTNLGRALLPEAAARAVAAAAQQYSDLEFNLQQGTRGSRQDHVQPLLRHLTGAEDALVVNNNAAAVLLALTALADDKKVILSRGEMVEIGGSFRIPEVMAQSGCRLVEVGTTNKTYLRDYAAAVDEETALLLKVHPSNYRVVGFTAAVAVEELARLGRERQVPLMVDLGSGVMVDLTPYGLPPEPTVAATVAAGADVVTFSGDKLLGGPQAGILVGKKELIRRCRQHPLARALRIDKLSLAALTATLALYLTPEEAPAAIPALQMLTVDPAELSRRAAALAERIADACGPAVAVTVQPGFSAVGGGAMPGARLPTTLVALRPADFTVTRWQRRLLAGEPPVVARLQDDALLLDVRTVLSRQEAQLITALQNSLSPAAFAD